MSRQVAIPRLLEVGHGLLPRAGDLLRTAGFDLRHVVVGSGEGPTHEPAQVVCGSLGSVTHAAPLDGSLEQVASLAGRLIAEEATVAVAVGGGKVLDTVKLAAARTGVPFVAVPTAISNDGISSPVASIFDLEGRRRSFAAAMPEGVVVDLDVLAAAPPRTLRAGLGDLVSNLTALLDWELAGRRGREPYDAFSAMIAETAARPAMDLRSLDDAEAVGVVAKGLLLGGLAMAAAGTSRPCSGAEHLVSHALDELLGRDAALHGEQVALGTLVSAAAHGSPLLGAFRELFARLGVPARPEDLGLTTEQLARAVALGPSMRPDRYTVLSELDLSEPAVAHLLDRAFSDAPLRSGA